MVYGNPALVKAPWNVSSLRRIQGYIAHKLLNAVVKHTRAQRKACMGEAKRIFGVASCTEAIGLFKAWPAK